MRLGGHETFYPRPGWLTKGILHLRRGGKGIFSSPETADELGVGRNMSKAIGWWLLATGLAYRANRSAPLELTHFGEVLTDRDPYMDHLGTLWLVHASAMTLEAGTSLPWFFHHRRPGRCKREDLVEALNSELTQIKGRIPGIKSVQREVAVVLQSYAVPVPRSNNDPEDNLGSPLQRLNLWRFLQAADRYERSAPTSAPPESLGLVLSALGTNQPCDQLSEGVLLNIGISSLEMVRAASMLGRSREALVQFVLDSETMVGDKTMRLQTLAGERYIALLSNRSAIWARRYYDRIGVDKGER